MSDAFDALLDSLQEKISTMECKIVPSSFDPEDPQLKAVPRPYDWHWKSCEDILLKGEATVVMMQLPFFWQLSAPPCSVHIGVPQFLNQPSNMPVGAAAVRDAAVNAVVSRPEDAALFSLALLEQNIPLPPTWVLVYEARAQTWNIPIGLERAQLVAREIHLCPGLPLLTQCAVQAQEKNEDFHLSDEFSWVFKGSVPSISMKEEDLLPLESYQLPFALKENGGCECGGKNFVRA